MDIAMQDAYNLTWKLALVLKGCAQPKILGTYNSERKHIAEHLTEFDAEFAKLCGATTDLNMPTFHRLWEESHGFTSGCAHRYRHGLLVNEDVSTASINATAEAPLTLGMRMLPMQLIRRIDDWLINILDDMPSAGRFHVLVFAGDLLASERQTHEFAQLYEKLSSSSSSVLYRYSLLPEWEAAKEWPYEDVVVTPPRGRMLVKSSISSSSTAMIISR